MSQLTEAEIRASYRNLRNRPSLPGFAGFDRYPSQPGLNFQVTEFPALAQAGDATVLGNNQAFFFVRNPQGNTDPDAMVLDTDKLKALIGNIYDHQTRFTLLVDADALEGDPQRFVDKYQSFRPEQDEATRRALLGREVELIRDFVQSDGIAKLVGEVIAEKQQGGKGHLPAGRYVEGFLKEHFRLRGVQVEQPLQEAVWDVQGPDGRLLARQVYAPATSRAERPFELGTEPELQRLRSQGHEGAESILAAVGRAHALPKVDLLPPSRQENARSR